jgi:uncharacterized protein YecT (DUF1311 family)
MRANWFLFALIGIALTSTCVAQTKLPKAIATPKTGSSQANADDCEIGPYLPGVQCLAEMRKRQDAKLNVAYRAALAALPENNQWDSRRNQAQLLKAQTAWLKFRAEHCLVVGAQEGGSNMSITFHAQMCESSLTDERIMFLKTVGENK